MTSLYCKSAFRFQRWQKQECFVCGLLDSKSVKNFAAVFKRVPVVQVIQKLYVLEIYIDNLEHNERAINDAHNDKVQGIEQFLTWIKIESIKGSYYLRDNYKWCICTTSQLLIISESLHLIGMLYVFYKGRINLIIFKNCFRISSRRVYSTQNQTIAAWLRERKLSQTEYNR